MIEIIMETNYVTENGESVYYVQGFGYYYMKDGILPCAIKINK